MPPTNRSATKSKGKRGAKEKARAPPQTAHQRAQLVMPVSRVLRMMKRDRLQARISRLSAVAMAAALEYVVSEIAEISGDLCENDHKKRINSRHLLLGIKGDEELSKLFQGIVIREGGVLPQIHQALVPEKKKKTAKPKQPKPEVEATQEV